MNASIQLRLAEVAHFPETIFQKRFYKNNVPKIFVQKRFPRSCFPKAVFQKQLSKNNYQKNKKVFQNSFPKTMFQKRFSKSGFAKAVFQKPYSKNNFPKTICQKQFSKTIFRALLTHAAKKGCRWPGKETAKEAKSEGMPRRKVTCTGRRSEGREGSRRRKCVRNDFQA